MGLPQGLTVAGSATRCMQRVARASGGALMTARTVGGDTGRVRSRVLIVDDHAGFRAVARAALEADGYQVLGEAADGGHAVSAAAELRPDVVLLDVHLPDLDGFAVCKLLVALPEPPVVVLISSRPITDLRQRVAVSPAAGFLAKHELSGESLRTLVG